jgi:lipoprotein-releasing system ATP-binding protein
MQTIVTSNLTRQFQTPAGPLKILDGISIRLSAGENLAVVGPSGSGKSTFLQIIGTLDQPSSGSVSLLDKDPFSLSEPELAEFRNANIGFVFQEHHLLPQLTARENVLIPAVARGKAQYADSKRAAKLLERVGLEQRMDHRPGQLSGGERQRVAVARALMNGPSILLADEPTGSLDQVNAQAIGRLLLDLQKQDEVTLVCVTHNDELARCFDRCVRLENGKFVRLQAAGTIDSVSNSSADSGA